MAPPQSKTFMPDRLMHKNRLQEYTQKSALQLPVYQTINEGFPHAPKFRSTVLVNGEKYTSVHTFSQRKEAEQEVAKYALERAMKREEVEVFPLIHQEEILFCKSILHEFAAKMNLKIPKYTTSHAQGLQLVYVSSLVFDGKTFTGEVAGSKKVAEQLAARASIQSLLGSDSGTVLRQIIKAKGKHTASLQIANDSTFLPITVKQENSSQQLTDILHSDVGCFSEDTIIDSSYIRKRRLEISNWEQKKMRCLDQ
ncbi:Double-stranded RNA-binding protein 4 [Camellia lanceoleosa]|uniref:Double-stranded RNA-binding protein 4 n=1 Tax=Camellia lanceoleosa TaxID=1840588 RepID=A0ACC0F9L6_9ERIC|nr:Double-stranded RNA-binding protein 4 [Camellia lanceoleosa]